jgi:methionyl-tRNA formyltransferase
MGYVIDVVCSDPEHPVNDWLRRWAVRVGAGHEVRLHERVATLGSGDFLFLVSCTEIVRPEVRDRYRHTLVLHGSDLPEGRGMSPVVWQVLEGRSELTLSLLDAADPYDTGDVWAKKRFVVPRDAVVAEIDALLFDAEIELMDWALEHCDSARPAPQQGEPTYYPRRRPADSRLDADRSIAEQFDQLRVSDPERYPAFVEVRGRRFAVTLRPLDDDRAPHGS